MGPARTALFLAMLVSLALLTVATFEVLERVQAEPSNESVIAQQEGIRVVAEILGSPNLVDSDGDGVPDDNDNCPAVATPWFVPVGDTDCDGFTDADENFVGTNPNLICNTTTVKNDEPDAWPPDTNDDTFVNISDINLFKPAFGNTAAQAGYDKRVDLNTDNQINISDINPMKPVFGTSCTL